MIEALFRLLKLREKEYNNKIKFENKNIEKIDLDELIFLNTKIQTELDRISLETRTKMNYIEKEHNEQVKLSNVLRLATKYNKNTFQYI